MDTTDAPRLEAPRLRFALVITVADLEYLLAHNDEVERIETRMMFYGEDGEAHMADSLPKDMTIVSIQPLNHESVQLICESNQAGWKTTRGAEVRRVFHALYRRQPSTTTLPT